MNDLRIICNLYIFLSPHFTLLGGCSVNLKVFFFVLFILMSDEDK